MVFEVAWMGLGQHLREWGIGSVWVWGWRQWLSPCDSVVYTCSIWTML